MIRICWWTGILMRITASLLLWYLLSAVDWGGEWVGGVSSPRAWDLSLIPYSSSHLPVGAIVIPLPVKYYCWRVSAQALFQQGLTVLCFPRWRRDLPVIYTLTVSLSPYVHLLPSCRPPPPNAQIFICKESSSSIYCQCSNGLCKAAGKQRADEETLNRLLAALCTLQAGWSHRK